MYFVLYFMCLLYWLLASFLFSLQFLKAVFYLLIKFAHIFPIFFSSEMEKWQFQVNLILKSIEILPVYWKETYCVPYRVRSGCTFKVNSTDLFWVFTVYINMLII